MAINIIEEINKGDKVYYTRGAKVCCGVVIENQNEKIFTRSRCSCTIENDADGYIDCCTEVYKTKDEAVEALLSMLSDMVVYMNKQIDEQLIDIRKKQSYVEKLNKRIEKLKNDTDNGKL